MILTEENQSTRRKPCPIATSSTTNPTHWPVTEPRTLAVKAQQLPKPTVTKNSVKE